MESSDRVAEQGRSGERLATGAFQPVRVDKPWGHELIWAHADGYVGKVLHVREGHALSLQYHETKDETIHLLRGRMRFWVGPNGESLEEVELTEGQSFHIQPGTVHRMEAVTDVDILEASTPHLEDVVRLEDRYGRT
jgi:mannose-6-phosphate isomerase